MLLKINASISRPNSVHVCPCHLFIYVNHLHLHSSSWKLAGTNDKPNWLFSQTIKRLLEALTHAFCQFSCSNAAKAAADFESKVERPLRRLSCLPKRRSPWPTARHGNSIGAMVKSLQWWPHSCILKIPVLDVWAQLGRFLRHLDTKCDETCNNDYYDDGSDSSSFCLCIFTYLVWACWDTCQWTWPWTLVHTFLVLCIMSKNIALLELLLTILWSTYVSHSEPRIARSQEVMFVHHDASYHCKLKQNKQPYHLWITLPLYHRAPQASTPAHRNTNIINHT